jgi:two-component system response regulator PfeR
MQSAHILIIEDDHTLNSQMADLLHANGYSTEQYHDGQQGLLAATHKCFDLILLDVLLPTINGFEFLDQLRKDNHTPVMMMTACGAEEDRITGFRKGADDYIPKPFNFTEVLLRIDALLRRTGLNEKTQPLAPVLSVDELKLTRDSLTVYYANNSAELTAIEFRLLWTLVDNRKQVLNKPFLYQAVLEQVFSRYDRTLDMHLSRVRRKLITLGMPAQRLSTVYGKGYVFA